LKTYEIFFRNLNPLVVDWRITLDCNLNCGFCTVKEREKTKNLKGRKDYVTVNEVLRISKCLSRISNKLSRRILIHFTGGEPLIRRDVIEISRSLKSLNMLLSLDTNGTLIDERIEKILLNYYDGVTFSVDGLKDTHDAIRGKGTFETVIHNIRRLSMGRNVLNSKLKIDTNTAMTNLLSVNEIEELIQILSSLGVHSMRFIPVLHGSDYKLDPIKCKRLFKKIYSLKDRYPQINISRSYIKRVIQIISLDDKGYSELESPTCGCGRDSFMIDAFGGVWPCCMFTQNDIKNGIEWKTALKLLESDRLSIEFEKMKKSSNLSCKMCIIPFLKNARR